MPLIALRFLKDNEGERKISRNNLLLEVENRTYKREFMGYFNTHRIDEFTLLNDPMLPTIGSPHPFDPLATLVAVSFRTTNNPKMKVFVLTYDTERAINLFTDNPLNQPPEVFFGTYKYQAPMTVDSYGSPVLSSTGNRLDPTPTREVERTLFTITRNLPFYPLARKRKYQFKLNLTPFFGLPPFQGRINEMSAKRQLSSGILHYSETMEIEFRYYPDTMFDYYLDNDFRNLAGLMFLDGNNLPYTTPTMLNGRGGDIRFTDFAIDANLGADQKLYTIPPAMVPFYPHAPSNPLPNGLVPGPYNTEFHIQFRGISDQTKYETMKVVGGLGTQNWVLERGNISRTQSIWASGQARCRMLAYYLKYVPHLPEDWRALDFSKLGIT